jgi:enoyl-CoA hydratase/carnithine racemase
MSQDVQIERRNAVLWLTISREERRNAITAGVLEGISKGLALAESDRAIRAVVLTGAGDKAFCAGADLQDGKMFDLDPSEPYHRLAQLFRQARQATIPLIARVNGACVAGGMGLMSMCDMAVAAEHAVFGLPEVKIGVFPAQVLTLLQHHIPRRVLTRMCLTGQPLAAAQALEIGLVNEVSADLDAALDALLGDLLNCSPAAIRRGLYTMKKIESMAFEECMSFTESQIALFAMTEDAREGQSAFREKRKARWTAK